MTVSQTMTLERIKHSESKKSFSDRELLTDRVIVDFDDNGTILESRITSELVCYPEDDIYISNMEQPFDMALSFIENIRTAFIPGLLHAAPCSPDTYAKKLLKDTHTFGGIIQFASGRTKATLNGNKFIEYYDASNAEIKFEAEVNLNGMFFDGQYTSWNRNRDVIALGLLKKNKPVGVWKRFDESDNQTVSISFNDASKAENILRVYSGNCVNSRQETPTLILELDVNNGKPAGKFLYREREYKRRRWTSKTVVGRMIGEHLIGKVAFCESDHTLTLINFATSRPVGRMYSIVITSSFRPSKGSACNYRSFVEHLRNNVSLYGWIGALAMDSDNHCGVVYWRTTSEFFEIIHDKTRTTNILAHGTPRLRFYCEDDGENLKYYSFNDLILSWELETNRDFLLKRSRALKGIHESVLDSLVSHFHLKEKNLSFRQIKEDVLFTLKELADCV